MGQVEPIAQRDEVMGRAPTVQAMTKEQAMELWGSATDQKRVVVTASVAILSGLSPKLEAFAIVDTCESVLAVLFL
jgi:hypothetical protein